MAHDMTNYLERKQVHKFGPVEKKTNIENSQVSILFQKSHTKVYIQTGLK